MNPTKALLADARKVVNQIKAAWQRDEIHTWDDVRRYNDVPEVFSSQPLTWRVLSDQYLTWLDTCLADRIQRVQSGEMSASNQKVITSVEGLTKVANDLGEFKLKAFQRTAATTAKELLFEMQQTQSILCDAPTGTGKTFLAGALVKEGDARGIFSGPSAVKCLYICPKRVKVKVQRLFERFGLAHLVTVMSRSELTSSFGRMFYSEVETDLYDKDGDPITRIDIHPFMAPAMLIIDECHGYKNANAKATKIIRAFTRLNGTKPLGFDKPIRILQLWMSATPFITVDNAASWCISTQMDYIGLKVTEENWSSISRTFTSQPSRPSIEAGKRLRSAFGANIVSFKNVRPEFPPINQTLIVKATESDMAIYEAAYERYLERRAAMGKDPDSNNVFGPFIPFRTTAECIRGKYTAPLMFNDWKSGKVYPVAGLCFQQSVCDLVISLVDMGMPRELISLIWGGKRQVKESDLLTREEIIEVNNMSARGEIVDRETYHKFRLTLLHMEDRIRHDETEDEQKIRIEKMSRLGLVKQTEAEQQANMDRFQDGDTQCCIFTLPSGGVGIDLDHQHDRTKPRVVYVTVPYYTEEFIQAFGRCARITTKSTTYQFVPCLDGSIEATHVMPLVDRKMNSLKAVLAKDEDFVALLHRDAYINRGKIEFLSADAARKQAAEAEYVGDEALVFSEEDIQQDND